MEFRLWLESISTELHSNITAYHQTSIEAAKKIMRFGFNLKHSTQNIIWFTTDMETLNSNNIGANARGAIIEVSVNIKNPAGWDEYNNLMLAQLKSQGYDGVILTNKDGTFDGFVFDPKKIKPLRII